MPTHTSRCIGLIGGLSVGAAVHYYAQLARIQSERNQPLELVMVHAQMSQVLAYVHANDTGSLVRYLVSLLTRLKHAGATLAAIPAVTPHFCIRELAPLSPLPLANIFDPLRAEIARRSLRRVSVFGTRYVMESRLFGLVPELDIVLPQQEEVDSIHSTYIAIAENGYGTSEQRAGLSRLAQALCKRERLDAILLAGTDLSLVFHPQNTPFPHLDCAALHIEAICRSLLEVPTPNPPEA